LKQSSNSAGPDEETRAYGERLLDEVRNMFKVIHERDNMIPEDFTNTLEKAKGSRKNNFTFLHLSFSPSLADTSLAPDLIKLAAK